MFIQKIDKNNNYKLHYTCKLCGAKYVYETDKCFVCGWLFDKAQNENPNLDIGKNILSLIKYKCVFYLNEDKLLGMDQEYLQGVVRVLYDKNPKYYDKYDIREIDKMILLKHKPCENPPYKCKMCGLGDIKHCFYICEYCGWEDDSLQNDEPDYFGGANEMSLNQYREFWNNNKEKILKSKNRCFKAVDLSRKYYEKHFKEINESILEQEESERQKLYELAKEYKKEN